MELNGERGARGLGDNFYALCADGCIGNISNRLDSIGPRQKVDYVFETGDEGLGHFRHTVEMIHARSSLYRDEMKMNSVTTNSKKDMPAVQTPDILVYAATHQHIHPTDETARPDYFQELVKRIPIKIDYLDDAFVRTASEGYTPDVITKLIQDHHLTRRQRRR